MRKSELTLTGATYRLTPANWGETWIMIDEDAASQSVANAFGLESVDPDSDPNDVPESVKIARDAAGNFYAILEPFTRGHVVYNGDMSRRSPSSSASRSSPSDPSCPRFITPSPWRAP